MAERNAATPEDQQIVFRVGVNLGDIIVEDDDIFGDDVNVAARLEVLARARRDPPPCRHPRRGCAKGSL